MAVVQIFRCHLLERSPRPRSSPFLMDTLVLQIGMDLQGWIHRVIRLALADALSSRAAGIKVDGVGLLARGGERGG